MKKHSTGKKMEWIKELDEETIIEKLEGDARLIYEFCGLEVLKALWENLPGINLYISTKSLIELQKEYIKRHYTGDNIKELAAKLKISERFIYKVIEE